MKRAGSGQFSLFDDNTSPVEKSEVLEKENYF